MSAGDFDARYWKLYRAERVKLVTAADPKCKKPGQVALTAPQITHVARRARKLHTAEAQRRRKGSR